VFGEQNRVGDLKPKDSSSSLVFGDEYSWEWILKSEVIKSPPKSLKLEPPPHGGISNPNPQGILLKPKK